MNSKWNKGGEKLFIPLVKIYDWNDFQDIKATVKVYFTSYNQVTAQKLSKGCVFECTAFNMPIYSKVATLFGVDRKFAEPVDIARYNDYQKERQAWIAELANATIRDLEKMGFKKGQFKSCVIVGEQEQES